MSLGNGYLQRKGTQLSFTTDAVYGTTTRPETGDFTVVLYGAILGKKALVIHNNDSAPAYDTRYFTEASSSAPYVTGEINYIKFIYIDDATIIYIVSQGGGAITPGGGSVNTDNGISGDGSSDSPIILGGKPFNQNTAILVNEFLLQILGDDGEGNNVELDINQIKAGIYATDTFGNLSRVEVNQDPGAAAGEVSNIDASGNKAAVIASGNGTTASVSVEYTDEASGLTKAVGIDGVAAGISVADSKDNVGFKGSSLFPQSDDKQYAQFGAIAKRFTQFVGNWGPVGNTFNQISGTQTFGGVYTPAVDTMVRITYSANIASYSSGTVTIGVNYTDTNNTTHTNQVLFTWNAAGCVVTTPAVILVKGGTSLGVTWTMGGNVAKVGFMVEPVFN